MKDTSVILIFLVSMMMISCESLSKRYENKGDDFFTKEQYLNSIEFYKKSLRFDKNNIEANHSLGRAYDNLGDFKAAILYYSKAIEIDSLFALAYRSRGYARYKLGDFPKAINDYLIALTIDSNNATAYQNAGAIYKELCDYNKAREYFYASLKFEPKHWGVLDELANIEFDLGNYDSCLTISYRILGAPSDHPDGQYGRLGLVYNALHQWDSSIIYFNKAIELNSDFATYYNNRGNSLSYLKRYDEALIDYNKAIRLDSLNPSIYTNKADVYYNIKQYKNAIENYSKAISLSKLYEGYNCGISYNNRAWAKKKSGDIKGYEADIKSARDLGYPDNYKAYSNLESCFYNGEK